MLEQVAKIWVLILMLGFMEAEGREGRELISGAGRKDGENSGCLNVLLCRMFSTVTRNGSYTQRQKSKLVHWQGNAGE